MDKIIETYIDRYSEVSATSVEGQIRDKLQALVVQAAVPHEAFDNPANMILPIRRILGVQ